MADQTRSQPPRANGPVRHAGNVPPLIADHNRFSPVGSTRILEELRGAILQR
jgi:hypothetical protein